MTVLSVLEIGKVRFVSFETFGNKHSLFTVTNQIEVKLLAKPSKEENEGDRSVSVLPHSVFHSTKSFSVAYFRKSVIIFPS